MRLHGFLILLILGLMAGCAAPAPKPVEVLDERTGLTLASLKEPIELLPQADGIVFGKRPSFAYLGPLEWNRMGTIGYGLWVHIAPGTDRQVVDIRTPGAFTLYLDDGPLTLSAVDMPTLGHDPYRAVVSWGQTAYFDLNVGMLKRMAASQKFELDVHATDGNTLRFFPSVETRETLSEFIRDRGLTGD
ncbi:MAG: hypothetical protein M3N50_13655 [Pseudomonadota bacterium]|nr:hypothetical protein [Pseudomonadota bacterium]